MPSFTGIKLFGVIGLVAALLFMSWATADRFSLAGKLDDMRDAQELCVQATVSPTASTDTCPAEIASAIGTAKAAAICDRALADATAATLFTVRTACSAPVKRLAAERDAKASEAASLRTAIDALRGEQTDAVRRAEARGAAQTIRKDRSDAAIRAAPSTGDSGGDRARCDAVCLRNLG